MPNSAAGKRSKSEASNPSRRAQKAKGAVAGSAVSELVYSGGTLDSIFDDLLAESGGKAPGGEQRESDA